MANYRAQVTLKTIDGNPANYTTGTWYCSALGTSEAEDFSVAVRGVYNGIISYMSGLIGQTNHIMKIYDLDDPEPRAPVSEYLWNLTSSPSGNSLPPEVALCLSFQADKISGEPQARRRGRIYMGPFDETSNSGGRPASGLITALSNAGDALLTASDSAGADWTWGVYSTVSVGLAPVSNGWVDNEFDTQRRRGRTFTTRTVFP